MAIEGVGEAVSFGVPDNMYGEVVWACVVPKGGKQISEKDVIAAASKSLAKVSAVQSNGGYAVGVR